MARLEDEDGIDGPFERGMRRAMREDRRVAPLAADTITDEQIHGLRALGLQSGNYDLVSLCHVALKPRTRPKRLREQARARCAEILNERGAKPSYPHTLTSEQFAIISVALDSSREREAAYVAKHPDRDDHLKALDELRKLWAFAGPVVLIPDPDTLKRIRAQAESYATRVTAATPDHYEASRVGVQEIIRRAYLAGADAGYVAARAEGRKP